MRMRPILLFALTALTLIPPRPLMPVDETRYVAAAWEMHIGGSPWLPHLNGAIYGHKPPLLFWLINLVWAVVASMPSRPDWSGRPSRRPAWQ